MNFQTLQELKITFIESYLPIERGRSPLTLKNYSLRLQRFLDFSQAKNPEDITTDNISNFRFHLSQEGIAPQTVNNYLIALKSFLKFLKLKDYRTIQPEQIVLANVPDGNIDFLSQEQVKQVLDAPENARDHAILEFLFATGVRVSELCKLTRDAVNLETCEAHVINGKGGKSSVVFFSQRARETLQTYLATRTDNHNSLFVSQKNGITRGLTTRAVQYLVKRYAKQANLNIRVSPHSLRRAFACSLLSKGANVFHVQKLLRHRSIQSTSHYLHSTNSELKAIYSQYCR